MVKYSFLCFVMCLYTSYQVYVTKYNCDKNVFYISLEIGSEPVYTTARITQSKRLSYFIPKIYNYKQSTTSKDLNDTLIQIGNNIYEGNIISDTIKFIDSNIQFNYFEFFVPKTYESNLFLKENSFSLHYQILHQNYSFVHLLTKQNIIKRNTFTFYQCDNNNECKLEFGTDVNKYNTNPQLHCKMKLSYNSWGCSMKSIRIFNKPFKSIYYFNTYAYVDVSRNKTIVPCSLIDYLLSEVLYENQCVLIKYENDEKRKLECFNYISLLNLDNIVIELEEGKIILKVGDLFTCGNKKDFICYSLFKCYNGVDKIILGGAFVKMFTSLYDYDNRQIILYTNSENIKIISSGEIEAKFKKKFYYNIIIVGICKGEIALLVIIIVFLIRIKYKYLINK